MLNTFFNDIADGMTGLGRLFADDTSIGHIANDKDSLQDMVNWPQLNQTSDTYSKIGLINVKYIFSR
jgi:hypothetical protein